jgi:hypothetical protein
MKKKYRKLQMLNEFAKNYKSEKPKEKFKNNLLSTKEGIASVTSVGCIRPDIYLNNDRCCDGCPYYDDCACKIKRLSNEKKQKK